MNTCRTRRATVEDIPAIIALGTQLHDVSPAFRGISIDAAKLDALARQLLASGQFLCVAEHDGQIVGVMAGLCVGHWFSNSKACSDLLLYVLPAFRGTTAAYRLASAYLAWAKDAGAVQITVGVSAVEGEEQSRAVEFYRAMGFVPMGVSLRWEADHVHRT